MTSNKLFDVLGLPSGLQEKVANGQVKLEIFPAWGQSSTIASSKSEFGSAMPMRGSSRNIVGEQDRTTHSHTTRVTDYDSRAVPTQTREYTTSFSRERNTVYDPDR